MVKIVLLVVFILILVYFSKYVIYAVFHPKTFFKYVYIDIRDYFKFKKYNRFTNYGVITMFTASGTQVFGSGKTISMIKDVIRIYKQYNNKLVYDPDEQVFKTQHIHIISNVELNGIPYIKFTGVNQFVDIDKYNFDSMDVAIYVLDESGAVFNSRQFKNNISSEMLTRLFRRAVEQYHVNYVKGQVGKVIPQPDGSLLVQGVDLLDNTNLFRNHKEI